MTRMKQRTVTSLVGRVLDDNVRLVVLELTQGDEDNVSLVDPDLRAATPSAVRTSIAQQDTHFLAHLPADMR